MAIPSGPPPVISIEARTSPIGEGAAATFTLERTGATSKELRVNVGVTEAGAMLSSSLDFTGRVTFGAGRDTTVLTLATDDDAVAEDDSAISVAITDADGYHVDDNASSASVTVLDDDSEGSRLEAGWTSFEWPRHRQTRCPKSHRRLGCCGG